MHKEVKENDSNAFGDNANHWCGSVRKFGFKEC